MKLTELQAIFVRHERDGIREYMPKVDTLAEAQGVMFHCPKCWLANGGPIGTHRVICWSRSRGVEDFVHPAPGRWRLDGTGLEDLTLNAEKPGGARSVQLLGGCKWHGFVDNGDAHD